MSYILDALKKADTERERGAVPGLRAQPVVGGVAASAGNPSHAGLPWALGGMAVIVALAGAYWLGVDSAAPPPTAAAPLPASASPAPVATLPAPTAQATARAAPVPSPKPAVPTVSTPGGTKPPRPAAPPAVEPPASAAPAPLLSELPAEVRSQIPAITIQGSVYSETPTQRLLLANGQVLNQGATLAPDLTVLEIGKGQSEFGFRGTRFRLVH